MYSVIKSNLAAIAMVACSMCSAHAADAGAGAIVFQQCMGCHSPERGVNQEGPALFGVVGRPAGIVADFAYSDAMRAAAAKGLIWTPQNITAYLENPRDYLRGVAGDPDVRNKMAFSLADPQQRDDVIAYLETLGQ